MTEAEWLAFEQANYLYYSSWQSSKRELDKYGLFTLYHFFTL